MIITGQAGQGKSSAIAKLVAGEAQNIEPYGPKDVIHHFIPLKPSPDHQVILLQDLLARLILKHDLPDIYVQSDNLATLKNRFANVLQQISKLQKPNIQERIYIDGLDQLQEEVHGLRDLSFLPGSFPNIVFVLGSRPDNTLKQLDRLNPHSDHQLKELSVGDFEQIIKRRNVSLRPELVISFHEAMRGNALYLDLAAKELHEAGPTSLDIIIQKIANNPENLFSVARDRLRQQRQLWNDVIKPVLGILLTTQAPLSYFALRTLITQSDGDMLGESLQRLGGLVEPDAQGRYYLFHQKLRDFLYLSDQRFDRDYVFDEDDVEGWHRQLAAWCEESMGGLEVIWQDLPAGHREQERRVYARQHYIAHLIAAKEWLRLWNILDTRSYSRSKMHYDPSTRSYVQDLDLARQATITAAEGVYNRGVELLPHLWRYSLLRCSLASQIDYFPDTVLEALAMIGRGQEAGDLAELLTRPSRKIHIFARMGVLVSDLVDTSLEGQHFKLRAIEIARTIKPIDQQAIALLIVARVFVQANQFTFVRSLCKEAVRAASTIETEDQRILALARVAQGLAEVKNFNRALDLTRIIRNSDRHARTLAFIAEKIAQDGQFDRAIKLTKTVTEPLWQVYAIRSIAEALILTKELEKALSLCNEALALAPEIHESNQRASALRDIAVALARAGQDKQAIQLAQTLEDDLCADTLRLIAKVLAQASHYDRAIDLAKAIKDLDYRTQALQDLAPLLAVANNYHATDTDVAQAIEEPNQHAVILRNIAESFAQAGNFDQARKYARSIDGATERTQALGDIAKALAQAGKLADASRICDEAASFARKIENAYQDGLALATIARALAQAGRCESAADLAQKITDKNQRAYTLGAIAIFASAEQTELAHSLCSEAITIAREIDEAVPTTRNLADVQQRPNAIYQIWFDSLLSAGALGSAAPLPSSPTDIIFRDFIFRIIVGALARSSLYTQADDIAREIVNVYQRADALSAIPHALIQAGHDDTAITKAYEIENPNRRADALRTIAEELVHKGDDQRAIELARAIESPNQRAYALASIAQVLVQTEQSEPVIELCEEAIQLTHTITMVSERARVMSIIPHILTQASQPIRAASLCADIASLESQIEDAGQRANILTIAAQAFSQIGDLDNTLDLSRKAAEIARKIEDNYLGALVLRAIAQVLAQADLPDEVLPLCNEAAIIARKIEETDQETDVPAQIARAEVLAYITETLALAGHYDRAADLAGQIEEANQRADALATICEIRARQKDRNGQLQLIQQHWSQATSREYFLRLLAMANQIIISRPDLGFAFERQFSWVNQFLIPQI